MRSLLSGLLMALLLAGSGIAWANPPPCDLVATEAHTDGNTVTTDHFTYDFTLGNRNADGVQFNQGTISHDGAIGLENSVVLSSEENQIAHDGYRFVSDNDVGTMTASVMNSDLMSSGRQFVGNFDYDGSGTTVAGQGILTSTTENGEVILTRNSPRNENSTASLVDIENPVGDVHTAQNLEPEGSRLWRMNATFV